MFAALFYAVLSQMTNAAVFEEPLFRSFLWGHLQIAGWKNGWIWLFQAGLPGADQQNQDDPPSDAPQRTDAD
jgi:hypothetical protein